MRMFTGDLKPDLVAVVSDSEGAVDLTTATAVRIIGKRGATKVIDRAPSSITVDGDTSVLTMLWQAGDTDDPGRIEFEAEAMWPGSKPQTYRLGVVDLSTDYDLATAP